MNLENTQVQMRKGILEYCILHIISRGEVYAPDMLDELTAAKMIVVEGTNGLNPNRGRHVSITN